MKKLNLNLDGVKAQLTKEQMKKINGGYYFCGCSDWGTIWGGVNNPDPWYCPSDYDTCSQLADTECISETGYYNNWYCH